MIRQHGPRILGLVALSVLVACGGGGGGVTPGTGALQLSVTDAPWVDETDTPCLAAAWITVDRVEARTASGWSTIPLVLAAGETSLTLDLLTLQNGIETGLAAGQVPTGEIDEIRLHLLGSTLEFVDSSVPDQEFKVPSGMSSGLKLKIDPPVLVAAGQTTGLILDINVAESFHSTGVGGDPSCEELKDGEAGAIFSPVVRVLNRNTHGIVTGIVEDGADLPWELKEVSAFVLGAASLDENLAGSTLSTASGHEFLEPGEYALLLEPGDYDLYVDLGAGAGRAYVVTVAVETGVITAQDLVVAAP